ncbi:MAG: shikimate dehydrogenase [Bacteroidaceae bacterium]|nr:shikimate dehydrogenase [Bacteroidaceae bacterium]
MTMLLGIIGKPLEHTQSPAFHNRKLKENNIPGEYKAFELDSIEEFPALLQNNPNLCALNVTKPYKEDVMQFLTEIDPAAKAIGAVNVVRIERTNGKIERIKGYNTDKEGFKESLRPLIQGRTDCKALILGTGGASKAVKQALTELGITFKFVSRSGGENRFAYSDLAPSVMNEYKLIINCTPLGMTPDTGSCPDIDYSAITDKHMAYDLIYSPAKTLFLAKCESRGASIKNGQDMFELQAEASWKIFNDK